jgi:hypothetical protein
MAVLSLSMFIAIFAGVLVRVLRRGATAYDAAARLPLEDEHV